jgi:hypothetical protein
LLLMMLLVSLFSVQYRAQPRWQRSRASARPACQRTARRARRGNAHV